MKKRFPWKVLVLVAVGILVLFGVVFSLTGNTVAKNGTWCTDTDNGQNIYVGGECVSYETSSSGGADVCLDSRKVKEYYCWSGYLVRPRCVSQTTVCQRGCVTDGNKPGYCRYM